MSISEVVNALGPLVDEGGVVTDAWAIEPYSRDWRGVFKGRPACVVLPSNTLQVAAVVRLCRRHGVAVVPHGGNTGLSGGATPDGSGEQVVLSLARMAAIRGVDVIGETMEVEAGCILQDAQEAAASKGLLLPISLAAEGSARIGGVISTNAGGTNVVRYGMTRGRVLGLEVVTSEGSIVSGLRRLRKDNAGYDWKHWFIGTEGTLGIVTAAVLQLAPTPKYRVTAMLSIPDVDSAIRILVSVRRAIGETLTGFELMSGQSLELVQKHQGIALPVSAASWHVLIEASSSLTGLRDAVESTLAAGMDCGDILDAVLAESHRQESELWALREGISEAEGKEGRSVKHDVSVPIASLPEFLRVADERVRALADVRLNVFGHVGDGNIHYNVIVSHDLNADSLNRLVHDIVQSFDGSISAEHGIGQYRVAEMIRTRSSPEVKLARRIKRALDPNGVLNPGKVLPLESTDLQPPANLD